VAGVLHPEVDVCVACRAQALDGIGDLRDDAEALRECAEVAVAELGEERVLVAEVEVDGGGGVLDLVGDAAHRDGLDAFAGEELPCRVQDQGADFLAFTFSAFSRSQTALRYLTVLS
jgi:hypothetical protein